MKRRWRYMNGWRAMGENCVAKKVEQNHCPFCKTLLQYV